MNKSRYILPILLTTLLSILLVGSARADSFQMEITNSKLNLGSAFVDTTVLPAPDNLVGSPLPDLWDARDTITLPGQPGVDPSSFQPAGCLSPVTFTVTWESAPGTPVPNDGQSGRPGPIANPDYPCAANPASATISGDKDAEGNVLIEPGDFRFPIMVVTSPIDGSPVPITLAASGQLSGEMNSGNGEMEISGPLEARVLLLTAPATAEYPVPPLQSYCSVPLGNVTLSTGISQPALVGFVGVPFANDNPEEAGALTGTWQVQGASIRNGNTVYGDPAVDRCINVDIASQGSGGLWLGAGISDPPPYPQCAAGQTGTWPDCVDPSPFRVGSVKMSPAKTKVRAGQKVKLTVRVSNSGETAGSTTVRVKLSNRKGFAPSLSSFSVRVAPRSSTSKTFVIKTNKKARGKKTVVSVSSAGKSAKTTVLVRR